MSSRRSFSGSPRCDLLPIWSLLREATKLKSGSSMTRTHQPSPQRSENMRRVRSKNTTPEMRVRSVLHRAGFRFRLHRRDLPGSPDIVLPTYRTAVWVNGCFWHGHDCRKGRSRPATNAEFWEQKRSRTRERDLVGHASAEAAGWKVRVLWECSLRSDVDALLSELAELRSEVGP
jgi:DNA mismatch endonuclease (patch repair protein)